MSNTHKDEFKKDLNHFLDLAARVNYHKDQITEKEFRSTLALLWPIMNRLKEPYDR